MFCLDKDNSSISIGIHRIRRFFCKEGLFGLSEEDCPQISEDLGPKELIRKVKQNKSTVVHRMRCRVVQKSTSEKQLKETKRQRKVAREKKIVDCLSSQMNACQAVLKPDCTKGTVQKSTGIKKAVINLLDTCINKPGASAEKQMTPTKKKPG